MTAGVASRTFAFAACCCALVLIVRYEGTAIAIRLAMMIITTRSSSMVKPDSSSARRLLIVASTCVSFSVVAATSASHFSSAPGAVGDLPLPGDLLGNGMRRVIGPKSGLTYSFLFTSVVRSFRGAGGGRVVRGETAEGLRPGESAVHGVGGCGARSVCGCFRGDGSGRRRDDGHDVREHRQRVEGQRPRACLRSPDDDALQRL